MILAEYSLTVVQNREEWGSVPPGFVVRVREKLQGALAG